MKTQKIVEDNENNRAQKNIPSRGDRFYSRFNYKQLLDEVFVISGIIKVEESVISRRLRLITLTETLIIPDITETESNNCFIINCFKENNDKRIIAANTVYFRTLINVQLSGKQIFTVFIKQSSSFATFVDLLVFSESLSLSNFSISCWVDEANREAMFLLRCP